MIAHWEQDGTDPATKNYSYDANGNLSTGGGRSYTWDVDNKPSGIIPSSGTAFQGESYSYGPDGERISRTRAGITTYSFGLWEEEYGGSSGTVKRAQYKWGGGVIAQREMIGSDTIGTMTYLHSDHLGSVSVATNSTGGYVNSSNPQQGYDPWGKVRLGAISQTTFNYTGQKLDGTGLLFYNARYYDPNVGKFVSADSIVPGLTDPQSLNRYSFVRNNPIMLTDPTGHCAKKDNGNRDYDSDKDCWNAYDKIINHNNMAFSYKKKVKEDLSDWNSEKLSKLLDWLNRGVKFTDTAAYYAWSGTSIGYVLEALGRVQKYLGAATDKALGISGGRTLTFELSDGPDLADQVGSTSSIRLNSQRFNSTSSSEFLIETVIHEIGHQVDFQAGGYSSTGSWRRAAGWYYNKSGELTLTAQGSAGAVSNNARSDPAEDYADTFVWMVQNANGNVYSNGRSTGDRANNAPNDPRQYALNSSFDVFRNYP